MDAFPQAPLATQSLTGTGEQMVISVILIPAREVPRSFIPRKLSSSCELMVEIFVDTNLSVYFDCRHNTAQLYKIINYMFP